MECLAGWSHGVMTSDRCNRCSKFVQRHIWAGDKCRCPAVGDIVPLWTVLSKVKNEYEMETEHAILTLRLTQCPATDIQVQCRTQFGTGAMSSAAACGLFLPSVVVQFTTVGSCVAVLTILRPIRGVILLGFSSARFLEEDALRISTVELILQGTRAWVDFKV